MNEQSVAQLALFLRNLGLALHLSGAPAQAVERVLSAVGQRFGVKVEGFAVLTFLALNGGGAFRRAADRNAAAAALRLQHGAPD